MPCEFLADMHPAITSFSQKDNAMRLRSRSLTKDFRVQIPSSTKALLRKGDGRRLQLMLAD